MVFRPIDVDGDSPLSPTRALARSLTPEKLSPLELATFQIFYNLCQGRIPKLVPIQQVENYLNFKVPDDDKVSYQQVQYAIKGLVRKRLLEKWVNCISDGVKVRKLAYYRIRIKVRHRG